MRKPLLMLFELFLFIHLCHAQIKLRDIPFNLDSVNQRDNNGKQGVWFFFDKTDSTVYAWQHFRNDTLNGPFERYWRNGLVSEKGFYNNGKLDSVFIGYWENGQKRGEANYRDGVLNGVVITFNKAGEITTRLNYINGEIDSNYEASFIDSSIVWDSSARAKVDTVVTTSSSDWNKRYAIYVNDTLSKEISFYKDLIVIENIFDKAVLTKRIVYSKEVSNKIEKIYFYKNGKLIKTEFYDKKGNLLKK